MENNRNLRKERVGIVVSDKMDKSAVANVRRKVKHKVYKKYVVKSKKFIFHDEENKCSIGDIVKIMETRPLSKHKKWRLVEILKKAK